MTSLAQQDLRQLGGALSVLTRQKRDHQRLDVLLEQLDPSADGSEHQRTLNRLARLVFPHAFAEESVLWPEIRRALPDGDELTLQVEREHQEINELWADLETEAPTSPRRHELIVRLVHVLRQDVRDEEDELLPRLQEALSTRRLQILGVAWETVRRTAPTRPHPVVSRRPPGNVVAALPLSLVDRSRDVLDTVSRRSPRLHGRAVRASGGLQKLSGQVERLLPLRRGEHPSTSRKQRGAAEVRTGMASATDED